MRTIKSLLEYERAFISSYVYLISHSCAHVHVLRVYVRERKRQNFAPTTNEIVGERKSKNLYHSTILRVFENPMPLTPIHCSIAYLSRTIRPQLSLPALLVSAMAPDLEIPFIYFITSGQYSRLVLHSLLGAVTLGTALSVLLTVFAYSPIVSHILKLDLKTVKDRCRFSSSLVAVCLVGSLSHVFIDSLHHEYNPLLFPLTYNSFDALVFMNDWTLASTIIPMTFLSLLVLFVAIEIRKGPKGIWERLLVE